MGHDIHITIHEYQYEWLDDNDHNISKLIRSELDGRMIEDGSDPEEWEETYGE